MNTRLSKAKRQSVCRLLLLALAVASVAQSVAQVDMFSPGYDFGTPKRAASRRFFRLGVLAGLKLDAEFSTSGQFDISQSQPGVPGVSGGEHFYDDGYVRVDQTGNAQEYTSFWGYDNASQVSANMLTMHSANAFSSATGDTSEGEASAVGIDLAYGGLLSRINEAYVGWEFGFGYLPTSIEASHTLVGQVTRTIHTFNMAGIVAPTAPYDGGDSGIGPTIHDIATETSDEKGATLNRKQTLDADLFLFRLGPMLHCDLNPRWAVSLGLGAAVGFIAGDLEFKDTLLVSDGTTSLNSGDIDDTDLMFGAYFNTTILYHLEEHGDLYLSLQFMSMSDATIGGGGHRAELDMTGTAFISAGINWPF